MSRPRHELSKLQLLHARDLFRAGVPIVDIARSLRRTRQVVKQRLIEAGIFKPDDVRPMKAWTEAEKRQVHAMRARGMTRRAIGAALDRSIGSVAAVIAGNRESFPKADRNIAEAAERAFAQALNGARYDDHPRSIQARITPPPFARPLMADTVSRGCALAW